jgi:hypothetical protein
VNIEVTRTLSGSVAVEWDRASGYPPAPRRNQYISHVPAGLTFGAVKIWWRGIDNRTDVLKRRPLEPPYRICGLWPARGHPVRYTEDPRDASAVGYEVGEPESLPSWRSLHGAKRKAVGTVIYARVLYRDPERTGRTLWEPTMAVAHRMSARHHWIVDWDAIERVRTVRARHIEDWQHLLAVEDKRLLEVMRTVRGGREQQWSIGRLAGWLYGSENLDYLPDRVDDAWVVESRTEEGGRIYEVGIGRGRWGGADLVGRSTELSEAMETARGRIEMSRDRLQAKLIGLGGFGLDLAACRDRWPAPNINFVPAVVDRAAQLEQLQKHYEQLEGDGATPMGDDTD